MIENLAYLLKRNDIKKSELFQSGYLENTTPAYELYISLKGTLRKIIMDEDTSISYICEGSVNDSEKQSMNIEFGGLSHEI